MASTPIFRKDFKILADLRIKEAEVLLQGGKPNGAYYLAGYAVECALKACIARRFKMYQFPPKPEEIRELYIHKLDRLVSAAGLEVELKNEISANQGFAANWSTVKDWTEESRYKTSGLNGKDMYTAVVAANGVLAWIKRRW